MEVTYAHGGKVHTVKAANCILACWHVVIPYICEELPEKQKEALHSRRKFRCSIPTSHFGTGKPSRNSGRTPSMLPADTTRT